MVAKLSQIVAYYPRKTLVCVDSMRCFSSKNRQIRPKSPSV